MRCTHFGSEDSIVSAFHKILLQRQWMTNEIVGVDDLLWQQLQFGVKFRHTILRQQIQQIQTEQKIFILRFTNFFSATTKETTIKVSHEWMSRDKENLTCNRSSNTSIEICNAQKRQYLLWQR